MLGLKKDIFVNCYGTKSTSSFSRSLKIHTTKNFSWGKGGLNFCNNFICCLPPVKGIQKIQRKRFMNSYVKCTPKRKKRHLIFSFISCQIVMWWQRDNISCSKGYFSEGLSQYGHTINGQSYHCDPRLSPEPVIAENVVSAHIVRARLNKNNQVSVGFLPKL